jgi:hypothetical protein
LLGDRNDNFQDEWCDRIGRPDASLIDMKRSFSTLVLWLLIAILPLNAAATRFACCWPTGEEATSECEQHRGMTKQGDAPMAKHRAAMGERCSHCSLCCAPTPALQQNAIAVPFNSTIAHAEASTEPHHSSCTRDRLDRPPKSFLS